MTQRARRIELPKADAQWLLEIVKTHITDSVLRGTATPEDFKPYNDCIRRIKHVAET